jgi:hypothetical protein
MRDKNGTGNDDVPGDVLKLLGEYGLKTVTAQDINKNVYATEKWADRFIELTMIALKNKPEATKHSDHHTDGLFAQTTQIQWNL